MTSKNIASGILKAIFTIVFILLSIWFLYTIQSVIIYLIIALILTLIGNPIKSFLVQKLRFKNGFAAITTIIIFLFIAVGFLMLFVPLILAQSQNLSLLNTSEIEKNLQLLIANFTIFLEHHNIDSKTFLKQSDLTSIVNINIVPNFLNAILGTISSFGVSVGSTLFITFFFLKDRALFSDNLKKIIPDAHEAKFLNAVNKTIDMLSRYFSAILIQLVIVFILYLIVLLVFGVQNAFIIAFLCGIINIVPYVGPLIGAVFATILCMLTNINADFQSETLPNAIYVLIGFVIVHLIDSNILQPIIFSKSVKSHPLEIFLVILTAGVISGILGMLVAIPIYTIVKVIIKEFFPDNHLIQQFTKDI